VGARPKLCNLHSCLCFLYEKPILEHDEFKTAYINTSVFARRCPHNIVDTVMFAPNVKEHHKYLLRRQKQRRLQYFMVCSVNPPKVKNLQNTANMTVFGALRTSAPASTTAMTATAATTATTAAPATAGTLGALHCRCAKPYKQAVSDKVMASA